MILYKGGEEVHSPSCTARNRLRERRDRFKTQIHVTYSENKSIGEKCYLLSFQSQLNENLLQFFIHKVDTKLFKSIFLQSKWKQKEIL